LISIVSSMLHIHFTTKATAPQHQPHVDMYITRADSKRNKFSLL